MFTSVTLSFGSRAAAAAALFAAALALRAGPFGAIDGMPYVTCYLAVLVSAVVAGQRLTLAGAAVCAVVGWYAFNPPRFDWSPSFAKVVYTLVFLAGAAFVTVIVRRVQAQDAALRRDLADRRRLEADLSDLYDRAPCGYFSLDPDGRFIKVNARVVEWVGQPAHDLLGRSYTDILTDEACAAFARGFPVLKREGHLGPIEFDIGADLAAGGTRRRVSVTSSAERDADGRFVRSRSVMYDMTDQHRMRQALDRAVHEMQAVVDNDLVGAMKVRDRRVLWTNRAMTRMFGYGAEGMHGIPTRQLYLDDLAYREIGATAYPELLAGRTFRTTVEVARQDGTPFWVDVSAVLLDRAEGVSLWLMLDVTAQKHNELRVEQIAFSDALTGLPNRLQLARRLQAAIDEHRESGRPFALAFVDLDGFKEVNDTFGHAAGDLLLVEAARRMTRSLRPHDTVARIGGDEFVLLLARLDATDGCRAALMRVREAVGAPYPLTPDGDSPAAAGRTATGVSASIGVALFPHDDVRAEGLMGLADHAMYEAKRAGGNRILLSDGTCWPMPAPEAAATSALPQVQPAGHGAGRY